MAAKMAPSGPALGTLLAPSGHSLGTLLETNMDCDIDFDKRLRQESSKTRQELPGKVPDVPRGPREAPWEAARGPGTPQEVPGRLPGRLQEAPRGSRSLIVSPQEAPKASQSRTEFSKRSKTLCEGVK